MEQAENRRLTELPWYFPSEILEPLMLWKYEERFLGVYWDQDEDCAMVSVDLAWQCVERQDVSGNLGRA